MHAPPPRREPDTDHLNLTQTAQIHLADAQATERAGGALAGAITGGMVLTLAGDLGAGKTTLVRGLLHARGWAGPVKSPTYTLVEDYPLSSLYLYHFDFYRFADPQEWETSGLAECFRADSVCLVEWPERVAGLLPVPDLALVFSYPSQDRDGRELAVSAHTPQGQKCLHAIVSDPAFKEEAD
jgi:tRNA threonylcarbamoyladenosine biosynthesis protein TsaE